MSSRKSTITRTARSTTRRCQSCAKRFRGQPNWNVELRAGFAQWSLCPSCQTVEQNTEAVINEATLDYFQDRYGRIGGVPKGLGSIGDGHADEVA